MKYPNIRLRSKIDDFLKTEFGLEIPSSKIKKKYVSEKIDSNIIELTYCFSYTIFIVNYYDDFSKIVFSIKDFLSRQNFESANARLISEEEIGAYATLGFEIFVVVKKNRELKKFSFISKG